MYLPGYLEVSDKALVVPALQGKGYYFALDNAIAICYTRYNR